MIDCETVRQVWAVSFGSVGRWSGAARQAARPVRSRRTSCTSVYKALRKITAPAAIQRAEAPELYSRTATASSIVRARTPKAEIRALTP